MLCAPAAFIFQSKHTFYCTRSICISRFLLQLVSTWTIPPGFLRKKGTGCISFQFIAIKKRMWHLSLRCLGKNTWNNGGSFSKSDSIHFLPKSSPRSGFELTSGCKWRSNKPSALVSWGFKSWFFEFQGHDSKLPFPTTELIRDSGFLYALRDLPGFCALWGV